MATILVIDDQEPIRSLLRAALEGAKEENPFAAEYQDLTLREYVPIFLERVKGELEEKTWRCYKQNLDHHVVPNLGAVKVCKMTVWHVSKFLAAKRKARYGAKNGLEGKLYSKTALRLMKAALSSLLTDAVEVDGFLKTNPALAVTSRKKRNRSKTSDPEVRAMPWAQRDAFLSHALIREQPGLLPFRLRVMWEVRARTGLRPEEAYALHTGDIDLQSKLLRVNWAVSYGQLKSSKTKGSTRMVELSEGVASLLADYVDFVKAEAVAGNRPEPFWLFPGRSGGLVTEADERWHRGLFRQ
ncbi:MAG: tyrosine-type recombinase/integrase, partial [Nitrospirota bacterium]